MYSVQAIEVKLSLLDYGESSPALPSGHPFMSVQSSFYWSSSSVVPSPPDAWEVSMTQGNASTFPKTSSFYVWPVRGGQ